MSSSPTPLIRIGAQADYQIDRCPIDPMTQTFTASQPSSRLVEYDALRRRLWILGQRCHHGATGSAVAALAFAGLVARPVVARRPRPVPSLVALAAAGGAMMAHDWKDHSIWFERGYGSQP